MLRGTLLPALVFLMLAPVATGGCDKPASESNANVAVEDGTPAAKPAEPVKTPAEATVKTPEAATANPATTEPAKAKPAAKAGGEVLFDPKNPPPGYRNCHRNHCHKNDGTVESYQRVMQEMGATRIVGGLDPSKLPPAPADVAAPPTNAEKTASGLASVLLQKGTSEQKPTATSKVRVHYSGWTTDGKPFDSSLARGRPAEFPLDRVIEGWREGILLMTVGEERRLWIPEALAYKGRAGRPAGMLVFDVTLLAVLD